MKKLMFACVLLSACEKVKPVDPLTQGAVKVSTFAELDKNVGKKVYLSGRTINVDGRAGIEFDGGVVFVSGMGAWETKAYLTGVGTLTKEMDEKKPLYFLEDFKSRGMGMGKTK